MNYTGSIVNLFADAGYNVRRGPAALCNFIEVEFITGAFDARGVREFVGWLYERRGEGDFEFGEQF